MIRVLLVDDQELVRSGFRIILDSEPDIEVVGEAATGVEAVRLASELCPDVICMDVEMPEMDGIEASRQILTGAVPGPAILILTTFGHDAYLFDALVAGVSGFLLKTSRAEQLIDAVHSLAAGNALLGPDVTRAVMERAAGSRTLTSSNRPGDDPALSDPVSAAAAQAQKRHRSEASAELSAEERAGRAASAASAEAMDRAGLTERERQVLALVAEGRSNAEIAAELFLGEATVKTHVSNLLQKLGARDRVQLVVWALGQR
ncbi:MAG: response regulator [Leucobacter sp.]